MCANGEGARAHPIVASASFGFAREWYVSLALAPRHAFCSRSEGRLCDRCMPDSYRRIRSATQGLSLARARSAQMAVSMPLRVSAGRSMIERVLVLSALARAGVDAFGHLPDIIHEDSPAPTPTPVPCEDYADQASCPFYRGSGCFWSVGYGQCTSTDPDPCLEFSDDAADDTGWMCTFYNDQCTWTGASCVFDECYYYDEATCPSSSYGSQCFWAYGNGYGMERCTSNDPCSEYELEYQCTPSFSMLDQCAWDGTSCETDECSYYHDMASCPSWSYGSQCFWTWGMSGTEVCTSRDPCSGCLLYTSPSPRD